MVSERLRVKDVKRSWTHAKPSMRLSTVFFSTRVRARFSASFAPSMVAMSGTWNHTARANVRELYTMVDQYLRPSLYRSKEDEVRWEITTVECDLSEGFLDDGME